MTEVLSQDEIDQLLAVIEAENNEPEDFRPASDSRKIKIYDFKRPDKFSREQIRTISIIHESFSRDVTALFSGFFKTPVQVHVASVDQLTYEEFIRSIPIPTTFAAIKMETLKGGAVVEIDPAVTHAMINRLFGGAGEITEQHELTVLEKKVMADIITNYILAPLRDAWRRVIDFNPSLTGIETNPQLCRIAPPGEMIVLVTFECKVGEAEGMINLCFPYLTLAPLLPRLTAEFWYTGVERKPEIPCGAASLSEALDTITIPVMAALGKKNMPLKTVKEIKEGSIIELDTLAGEPVDLFAGGVPIGRGEVVVIDENFGVRVTELVGERHGKLETV
jgi:flagellar motor switch protein FliM